VRRPGDADAGGDVGPHRRVETDVVALGEAQLDPVGRGPGLFDRNRLQVVDLSGVDFFGSSFIELLYRVWSRLHNRGGQFALCGLSPYCREVIEVTNLNTLWPLYASVDEAVAGVKAA